MNLRIIFLLVTVYLSGISFSDGQSYKWDWATMGLGGSGGAVMCTDKFNNIVVAGALEKNAIDTFGAFVLQSDSGTIRPDTDYVSSTIVVLKYDPYGNIMWANSSKNGLAFYSGIDADENGNVYLFGYYTSPLVTFGQYTLHKPGIGNTYFFVKYSPRGDVMNAFNVFNLDSIQYFYYLYDQPNNLCVQNDKLYVMLSYSGRKVNFGSFSVWNNDTSGHFPDILVAKFDTSGNAKWAKSIGGVDAERAIGIGITSEENIYLGCSFESPSIQLGNITVNRQAALYYGNTLWIKLDSTGSVKNARNLGGHIGSIATMHAITKPNEELLMGGIFDSILTIDNVTLSTKAGGGSFLAKFDSSFSLIWLKNLGDSVMVGSITDGACGNIWICGYAFYDSGSIEGHPIHLDEIIGYDRRMYVAGWTDAGKYITASVLPTGGFTGQIVGDQQGNLYIASNYGGEDNHWSFAYTIGRSTLFDYYYNSALAKVGYVSIHDLFVAKFTTDSTTSTTALCSDKKHFPQGSRWIHNLFMERRE